MEEKRITQKQLKKVWNMKKGKAIETIIIYKFQSIEG